MRWPCFMCSDDGLDGGATAHLAFDCGCDPAFLPGGVDPELVGAGGIMALIACVGKIRFRIAPLTASMAGITVSSV